MFCITKDYGFFKSIWEIVTADEFINFNHLEFKLIENFDPNALLEKDLNLLFFDSQ